MRVTLKHWEAFLNMAEESPSLITSRFNGLQGKAEGNALWQTVAQKLNGLGYGDKSVDEWRRAVTDWRNKTKSKAAKLRQNAFQTGGGPPPDLPPLTNIEERLLNLMGKKSYEGDEGTIELGKPMQQTTNPLPIFQNVVDDIEVLSKTPNNPTEQSTSKEQFSEKLIINKEHSYSQSRKRNYKSEDSKSNSENPKRVKLNQVPRVSKRLEDMTTESLNVLKSIEQNTSRIATCYERLICFLEKSQPTNQQASNEYLFRL